MRVVFTLLFALLLTSVGCESMRSVKVDNPVIGPPPPRVADASKQNHIHLAGKSPPKRVEEKLADAGDEEASPRVQTVSREVGERDIDEDTVIATVNDSQIFAREVLGDHAAGFQEARKRIEELKDDPVRYVRAKAEYRQMQEQILKKTLPMAIDVRLLVLALRSELKPEQIKSLRESIDTAFKTGRQDAMMKAFDAKSVPELESKMAEKGYDFNQFRQSYEEVEMAQAYFSVKGGKPADPDRIEMLKYYEDNKEKYAFPTQIKWQQILIKNSKHDSSEDARKVIDQAAEELLKGKSFTSVADEFSEGPTADKGGVYDWMKAGSLVDKDLEKRLFEMPVGEVSPVVESRDGWQIVVVLNKKEAGYQPFHDVQKEIKTEMMQKEMREMAKKLPQELRKKADVWTIFDDQQADASKAEKDSAVGGDEETPLE